MDCFGGRHGCHHKLCACLILGIFTAAAASGKALFNQAFFWHRLNMILTLNVLLFMNQRVDSFFIKFKLFFDNYNKLGEGF